MRPGRPRKIGYRFLLVFQIVLEVVKLAEEFCELGIVGIFLQDMMEQTHAEHKLVGMFLFLHVKFFGSAFSHRAKVVMTAEIEAHHVLNLAFDNFADVEMIGAFLLVAVAIHSIV